MRVSSKTLKRYRWVGEEAFRTLSYYFTVRWNSPTLGDYARYVLDPFSVPRDYSEERNPPTPGLPPQYTLLEMGPSAKNRYRLYYGLDILYLSDQPGEVLEHLFWHVNAETFRTTGNFLLIHAGALATPGGDGLLLPGDSGAGKSTLVAALVRSGFGYLSDEAAAIDPVSGLLFPYPKAITLKKDRDGRFGLFAELRPKENGWPSLRAQWHLRAEDIRPDSPDGPCEVRFIVAPRYVEGAGAEVTALSTAEAAMELARSALNLGLYRGRALPLLAGVAQRATAFRLRSGDLAQAVEAIHRLTVPGRRVQVP